MELNHLHAVRVLYTHHGIGQSLCRIGFSNARCSLQDDILFIPDKCLQNIIASLVHIHLTEEVLPAVKGKGDLLFVLFLCVFRFYIVIYKQSFQFFHVVGVRRYVSERFHGSLPWMLPLAHMGPVNLPDTRILFPRIVKHVIGRDDTATNQSSPASFCKHNIAGFHLVCKLPGCMSRHCVRSIRIVLLLHRLLHRCLAGILLIISNLFPAQSHNAFFTAFIPDSRTTARRIKPVANGFRLFIDQRILFCFAEICSPLHSIEEYLGRQLMGHLSCFPLLSQGPYPTYRFVNVITIDKVISCPRNLVAKSILLRGTSGFVYHLIIKMLVFDNPITHLLRCSGTAKCFESLYDRLEPFDERGF